MYFRFSDQQETLREAIRRALASEVKRHPGDGEEAARTLWKLASEQGWLAIMMPEASGGLGLGLCDALVLHEELGRALAPGPFLANTVLYPAFLAQCAHDRALESLSSPVLAGEAILAVGEISDRGVIYVEHPEMATHVLVAPADHNVLAIREIGDAERRGRRAFDRLRPIGEIAGNVGQGDEAIGTRNPDAIRRIRDAGRIAAAAEIVGCCEEVLRKTIDYAGIRHQFGKAIGSFQAVKHRLADAYVRLENAKTSVYYAAWAWDHSARQVELAADMAAACAGEMGPGLVCDCMQVHGGIGFTWESDLHLHLRRVQRLSLTLGTPRSAWRSVGDRIMRDDDAPSALAASPDAEKSPTMRQTSDAV